MMTDKKTRQWQWYDHTFKAMNTKVQLWLYSQTDLEILADVERLFHSFERTLSRFDPNSELSRLNNHQNGPFQASPILVDALEAALWAAEVTGGVYDPTILKALEKAGYDRSFDEIENVAPLQDKIVANGTKKIDSHRIWSGANLRDIQINRARREIHKLSDLRLDLGGMGKGWTVDRAADRLQGLGPFLINAGGDIFAYQTPPGEPGWEIQLIHPLQSDRFMATLHLHHQALATSTIAKRRWKSGEKIQHHLIDPRTGQSAQTDALSVSIVADRTMMAEVYAKVVLILGVERGLAYLNQLPGVEGLIYTASSELVCTEGFQKLLTRLEPDGYKTESQ